MRTKINVEVDADAWKLFSTYAELLCEREGKHVTKGRLLSAAILRIVLPRKEELAAEYNRRRLAKKMRKLPHAETSELAPAGILEPARPSACRAR